MNKSAFYQQHGRKLPEKSFYHNYTVYSTLIFVTIYSVLISANSYDCHFNKTILLSLNQLAFFETIDYPQLKNSNELSTCNITFALNDEWNYTNARLYIVQTTNSYGSAVEFVPDTTFSLSNSTVFSFKHNFDQIYYAMKGFIVFEKWDDSCLFESISRENPFMFNDETQYIYIVSSFRNYDSSFFYRKNDCKWQFSAPEGYGFKIVIQNFKLSNTTSFFIKNTTDIILNKRSAHFSTTYYNSDNWVQISLSEGDPDYFASPGFITEFSAWISIVKKQFEIVEKNCSIKINDDKNWTWTNVDQTLSGYENNVRCTFNLLVFPKSEVFVKFVYWSLEHYADFVRYFDDDDHAVVIKEYTRDVLFLPHYERPSIKQVLWEFISDGSIRYSGFSINFRYQECKCANSIIQCNALQFTIMDGTDYYCSNLNCRFTILSCPEEMSMIELDSGISHIAGIFKVISNNITILNVDSSNYLAKDVYAFLKSSNENILEVSTNPVKDKNKKMTISVTPFRAPKVDLRIYLTATSPIYILETSSITLATVQISEDLALQNLSITIYSTDSPDRIFQLYNNETLAVSIIGHHNCFENLYQHTCELTSQGFAVYIPPNVDSYVFLAFQISKKAGGCIFQKNIFQPRDNSGIKYTPIVAMSNDFEECIVYLLPEMWFNISSLWTTSSKKNVKIFSGTKMTRLYFEFNSKTAVKYRDIILFDGVYSIILPKSSTLYIGLNPVNFDYFDPLTISLNILYSYHSILATPNYIDSAEFNAKDLIVFEIGESPVKFTAIDYFMLPGENCVFVAGDNYYNINKTGDFLIFFNQNVTVRYTYATDAELNDGAIFFIETIEK